MKLNHSRTALSLLFISIFTASFGQDNGNKILMTVGGEKVTVNEFENVYHKNPNGKESDPKSLSEYLDLYINFRLKVKEARDLGYDTSAAFKNELAGYRKQLSQPYLTDTVISDKLMKEAYDRIQWDLRTSHILIKCDADALPKDTLIAYNKALKIRERILKGEDFGKIANAESDDPYAKQTKNGGDLGYFTALMGFVYPFETAAYNLKLGELSMPVRTQFGYHIIKVVDKVKHVEMSTAHIMVKFTKGMNKQDSANVEVKINELYQKLQKGENFDSVAYKYSEDPGSAKTGGKLQPFGRTSNYPAEFKDAAFSLTKDGDYAKPIKTRFGWHIIKRLSVKDVGTYAEMKNDLKARIAKDQRSNMSRTSLINKIKSWYAFKEDMKAKNEMASKTVMDSSIFKGKWEGKGLKTNKTIFTLAGKNYTQQDFAKYIENHQATRPAVAYEVLINGMYKSWVEESLIAYEESQLDVKYPKFKALMDEYRDGILLFELTDNKVWSKAVKDTVGLKNYYDKNKDHFKWEERADVKIFTCANEEIAKKVREMIKKNKSDKDILNEVNKNSQLNLQIDAKILNKGDNKMVDANWVPGLGADGKENGKIVFVDVIKILAPTPKTLAEAKGLVTAEYQTYLEKEWIDSLKKKYEVKVDQDVLKTVK